MKKGLILQGELPACWKYPPGSWFQYKRETLNQPKKIANDL